MKTVQQRCWDNYISTWKRAELDPYLTPYTKLKMIDPVPGDLFVIQQYKFGFWVSWKKMPKAHFLSIRCKRNSFSEVRSIIYNMPDTLISLGVVLLVRV